MTGITERFKAIAAQHAGERRDGKPAPQELFDKRIKTREMLEWMERREPDAPALEYTPDDASSREEAARENVSLARRMRRRFYQRSQKGREDFNRAERYGRER